MTGPILSATEALSIASRGNRDLVTWAEIRDMAETIAQQADQIAAASDLHRSWYKINGVHHDMTGLTSDPEDLPEGHVCWIAGMDVCSPADGEHVVLCCITCGGDGDDGPGHVQWPCATARTLGVKTQ